LELILYVPPTKQKFFKTEIIDDIIDPSFWDADDEICYLSDIK